MEFAQKNHIQERSCFDSYALSFYRFKSVLDMVQNVIFSGENYGLIKGPHQRASTHGIKQATVKKCLEPVKAIYVYVFSPPGFNILRRPLNLYPVILLIISSLSLVWFHVQDFFIYRHLLVGTYIAANHIGEIL